MNSFDPLQMGMEQRLREMSDADWADLTSRVRLPDPPPLTATSSHAEKRASIAAKANAMWNTERDHNGPTGPGSMAAAAAARAPKTDAPLPPPEPAVQQVFTTNRAQGYSGVAPADESEHARNNRLIDTIREGGLPR